MTHTAPLRVVVWATGTLGRHAIAGIDAHPALELVGVWVSDPAKDGRDAGDLAGLGRDLGVLASTDRDAVLATEPDCVVHCAMTDDRVLEAIDDLIGFLEAGVDVVSSGPVVLLHPGPALPEVFWQRIEDAGRRGGASLHINGIDPGWANDVLPLQLTSLSRRIDQVRVMEIADYATYDQAVAMGDLFGFGRPVDAGALLWQPGVLSMAWGPVVRQIAAGLDLVLDEPLQEVVDRRPAPEAVTTVCTEIAEGTMGAVRFEVIGSVDGVPRVVVEHVTRTHPDQVPEWPRPAEGEGCYRIEITGEPVMTLELSHHGEHGDHNVSGMIITAQRLVNAVPAVVAAEPGLVTALDLPLVTGRGLVPPSVSQEIPEN
ncbi:putative dihydrodipicolinate reductase domain protein [Aeromicrobium marinum DSM 15272]|uniref:Dihydrodipicolinate reductase domain protein n=1 Tax=Aeromicrobium marinum DSM 15272 TaxID=585531 RepID=E2SEN9_9ACTN|nr:diacylglycerol kinase [Aeromicrobium marinum]EFQ82336.1 putative dihydrodipicolinate reductase domain protein [Aeromicrobium marinum DSM 15272]